MDHREPELPGDPTLAEKFSRMRTIRLNRSDPRYPKGRRYTLEEISDGIREQSGGAVTMSPSALSKLESGKSADISLERATALAHFFGYPVGALAPRSEEDAKLSREVYISMGLMIDMKEAQVADIAFHAATLPEDARPGVLAIIKSILRSHGIKADDDTNRGKPD